MAARVGAPGDVHANAADLGETFFLQTLADRLGEAAGLGDGDVAGIGTRARNHVTGKLCTRSGHIDGHEGVVQRAQLRFGEPAEHHVLTVGETDIELHKALNARQRLELGRRDVAQSSVRNGGHGALGRTAGDAGPRPSLERVRGRQLNANTLADGRDLSGRCASGRGVTDGGDLRRDAAGPRG